jgi:hypothetical protein
MYLTHTKSNTRSGGVSCLLRTWHLLRAPDVPTAGWGARGGRVPSPPSPSISLALARVKCYDARADDVQGSGFNVDTVNAE